MTTPAVFSVGGANLCSSWLIVSDVAVHVVCSVHDLYSGEFMGTLGDEEPRSNRLVFIGKHLDEQLLREGFLSCAVNSQ